MRQIFCDGGDSFNGTFLMDLLNCMDGGTSDSLSTSDDRFNFLYFCLICAPEPGKYVCSQNASNYCTIKINHDINVNIV